MDKNVLITIGGVMTAGDNTGEKENVDVISPGTYYYKNGNHYLMYDEVMEDTGDPIRNLIRIGYDEMLVRKSGVVITEMLYRPNAPTFTHYKTPFGTFDLVIHTDRLQVKESDTLLEAIAEYTLEVNGKVTSTNEIRIAVEPRGSESSFRL